MRFQRRTEDNPLEKWSRGMLFGGAQGCNELD
jgi:hypothetical protein